MAKQIKKRVFYILSMLHPRLGTLKKYAIPKGMTKLLKIIPIMAPLKVYFQFSKFSPLPAPCDILKKIVKILTYIHLLG